MAGSIRGSGDGREEGLGASEPIAQRSLDSIARELRDAYFGFLAFAQLVRGDPRIPDEVHHTAGLMEAEAKRARVLSEHLVERARTAGADAPRKELPAAAVH